MRSSEFKAAIERAQTLASEKTSAYMCAEGLWWRCHRRLISDALLVRGWEVGHILPDGKLQPHSLTKFASLDGTEITYHKEQDRLELDG